MAEAAPSFQPATTAVGQFDLALPRRLFRDLVSDDEEATMIAERFVVVQGRPPALAFRHPSAGELVFRLLAWAAGEPNVEAACATDIAEVQLQCAGRRGPIANALGTGGYSAVVAASRAQDHPDHRPRDARRRHTTVAAVGYSLMTGRHGDTRVVAVVPDSSDRCLARLAVSEGYEVGEG